jgi:hypothetical protein
MAIEPKEVDVRGGPPADGRVRALAGTGDSARAEEAQATRERASQPAATALRNGRTDQETRRSTRTHEDITDRQKDLHVIPQRRAAEEEKKTAQQARLASIREQRAALVAQPLVRWLFTVPAEDRVEPLEVQLAATETQTPAEARREPAEARPAATETLTPAKARREPTEAQLAATEGLAPEEGPQQLQKESAELKEPKEVSRAEGAGGTRRAKGAEGISRAEGAGGSRRARGAEGARGADGAGRSRRGCRDCVARRGSTGKLRTRNEEDCSHPENMATRGKSTRAIHEKQAAVEEPPGMRRAREGGTAAEADTVRARREAERFAENAKMDLSNCLMEILTLREDQEGIRIRRSPGDYVEHLPWVLKRVFPRTLCGPGNDEQGRCACSGVRGSDGRCVSSGVRQNGDPGGGPEPGANYEPARGKLLGVLDEIQMLDRVTEARMPEPAVMRAQEVPGEQMTVAMVASVGDQIQETARLFNPHGSPLITWEGGENESVLKDIRKQSAAQRVPAP